MNNITKFILVASGGALLYNFLFRKKAALENIKINSIDVYIDKKKTGENFFLKLFYNLKINLLNTASVSVNIKSLEAKFYINGIQFGTITSNINTVIAANSLKDLNIAASVSSGDIIASILDVISENKATITVVGSIFTDLGLIEFKEEKII